MRFSGKGGRLNLEKIMLASGSPRRRELLNRVGIPFDVFVSDADEHCALPAEQAVVELSRRKALAAAAVYPGRFILAADTLVVLEQQVLGKPSSETDAERMLSALSGHTHEVCTGVTVISPSGSVYSGADYSFVSFCDIPPHEIHAYAFSGEPMDKAGAYGLQDNFTFHIVKSTSGSESNIIGFPVDEIKEDLKKHFNH
jgi:septum formation protein